jgi:hypothetical protein
VVTVMRFGGVIMGLRLHGQDSESHGGAHRVAQEDVSRLKAQAEANFHMYCIGLH